MFFGKGNILCLFEPLTLNIKCNYHIIFVYFLALCSSQVSFKGLLSCSPISTGTLRLFKPLTQQVKSLMVMQLIVNTKLRATRFLYVGSDGRNGCCLADFIFGLTGLKFG